MSKHMIPSFIKSEIITRSSEDHSIILESKYIYNKREGTLKSLNNIRQTIYKHVPTVAVYKLRILKNTTFLTEEEILQALCMVLIRDNTCKLGNKCKHKFTLSVKGPKMVEVEDLKKVGNKNITLIDRKAPLFYVDSGELLVIATAKSNTGLFHTAYSPVTVVFAGMTKDNYTLTIESTGSKSTEQIYDEAIKILSSS